MSSQPPASATSPVNPGDVLAGKYRVERVLGAGGMGVVVQAMHLELDERVALKFLRPAYARDWRAIERFRGEARAASALNHPHICTVYDVDEHAGQPFIVMELVAGSTLDVIGQQGLAFLTVIRLGARHIGVRSITMTSKGCVSSFATISSGSGKNWRTLRSSNTFGVPSRKQLAGSGKNRNSSV